MVTEASLATELSRAGSVTAAPGSGAVAFEIGGTHGSSSSLRVTLPPDVTFAYLLHRVKRWDGKRVKDLEDDRQGGL